MTRPLYEQYASAKDFLAELTEYHGDRAYIVNPARTMVAARCPSCPLRPRFPEPWELAKYPWRYQEGKQRHWTEIYTVLLFPTSVEEPSWDYMLWCDCPEERIIAAILTMRRDRQLRHAQEIEATILAMEEEAARTLGACATSPT